MLSVCGKLTRFLETHHCLVWVKAGGTRNIANLVSQANLTSLAEPNYWHLGRMDWNLDESIFAKQCLRASSSFVSPRSSRVLGIQVPSEAWRYTKSITHGISIRVHIGLGRVKPPALAPWKSSKQVQMGESDMSDMGPAGWTSHW